MNINKIKFLMSLALCMLLIVLPSCGNGSSALSESNLAKIYAAVIKRLYEDYRPPPSAVGYMTKYFIEESGGGKTSVGGPVSQSLQKAISSSLADMHKTFVWVDNITDVPKDISSGGGCQIVLGNIHLQRNNSVQVTASVYFGGTGGGGTTYIVELIDGVWTVTGKTGSSWIS